MAFQIRIGITSANATNGTGTEGTDKVTFPITSTYQTTSSTLVDAGRNTEGVFVGSVVGTPKRKIEVSWRVISIADYSKLAKFFNSHFTFYAYYFDQDDNAWETREFYVGDRVSKALQQEQWKSTNRGGLVEPSHIEGFKLSLIDTGTVTV